MLWPRGASPSIPLHQPRPGLGRGTESLGLPQQEEMTHTCQAEREPLGETRPGSAEKRTGCPRGRGERGGGKDQAWAVQAPGSATGTNFSTLRALPLGLQTGSANGRRLRPDLVSNRPARDRSAICVHKRKFQRETRPSLPTTRPRQVNKHQVGARSAPRSMTQRSPSLGTTGQS